MKTVYDPAYSTTATRVNSDSASHYAKGASLLDSRGNLHVLYTQACGSKYNFYYAAYDNNLNQIVNKTITLANSNKYCAPAIVEAPDGNVYIISVGIASSATEAKLEIWKIADNMKSLTKVCDPQTITLKGTDGTALTPSNIIVGSFRNGSDIDGYVPIIINNKDSDGTHYYYFSVKLPD